MIIPVNFLWAQLNGPQITGITEAMVEYLKSIFDTQLDYINTISVDTANSDHLTLLGILAGFARPVISIPDKDYFYFTEDLEKDTSHGFSSLENPSQGGRFVSLFKGMGQIDVPLDTEHYRALLKAYIQGEGEIGGLELLDDICYALSQVDIPGVEPFYKFEFMRYGEVPTGRSSGDLYIDVGSLENWKNPMEVYAILRGLADTVYSPIPQIFISIDIT